MMNEMERQAMMKAFDKCFPDVFKPNDVAIIVWEQAWKAAIQWMSEGINE